MTRRGDQQMLVPAHDVGVREPQRPALRLTHRAVIPAGPAAPRRAVMPGGCACLTSCRTRGTGSCSSSAIPATVSPSARS